MGILAVHTDLAGSGSDPTLRPVSASIFPLAFISDNLSGLKTLGNLDPLCDIAVAFKLSQLGAVLMQYSAAAAAQDALKASSALWQPEAEITHRRGCGAAARCPKRHYFPFAFSPSKIRAPSTSPWRRNTLSFLMVACSVGFPSALSTKRRIASGRDGFGFGWDLIQLSSTESSAGGILTPIREAPTLGRPRPLFRLSVIVDDDINNCYQILQAGARRQPRSRL